MLQLNTLCIYQHRTFIAYIHSGWGFCIICIVGVVYVRISLRRKYTSTQKRRQKRRQCQGSIHHDLDGADKTAEEGISQAISRAIVELAPVLKNEKRLANALWNMLMSMTGRIKQQHRAQSKKENTQKYYQTLRLMKSNLVQVVLLGQELRGIIYESFIFFLSSCSSVMAGA